MGDEPVDPLEAYNEEDNEEEDIAAVGMHIEGEEDDVPLPVVEEEE